MSDALLILNGKKADRPEIRQAVNRNDIAAGLSVYAVNVTRPPAAEIPFACPAE